MHCKCGGSCLDAAPRKTCAAATNVCWSLPAVFTALTVGRYCKRAEACAYNCMRIIIPLPANGMVRYSCLHWHTKMKPKMISIGAGSNQLALTKAAAQDKKQSMKPSWSTHLRPKLAPRDFGLTHKTMHAACRPKTAARWMQHMD